MMDHKVPIETAKQRIRQGMDRFEAMTKPLKWTKGLRK